MYHNYTLSKAPVDQVHMLDNHNDTWLQPFPASSVPTVWASAIGYKKWLLVVGGWLTADLDCPLDVVQVLDTSSKQWYTASLLPTPATRPSLAIVQDTLYIAWSNITEKALKVFIPTLLSDAKSYSLSVKPTCDWQTLPTTLTSFPLFVSFHGHLLAVGDRVHFRSVSTQYMLPCVLMLSTAGGFEGQNDKQHLSNAYMLQLQVIGG